MVSAQVKGKVQVSENSAQELNATAVRQVKDILDESEKADNTKKPATGHWSYSVPFAGVRYYSYWDGRSR